MPDKVETLEYRKRHHIELAKKSQIETHQLNQCFHYEPLLSSLPKRDQHFQKKISFLGKTMHAPLWVSSMTGGTGHAGSINRNLARVCAEFGLGMGLGSCRPLLESRVFFDDFNLRPLIGDEHPLMGNLGIAQIEELLGQKAHDRVSQLVDKLCLDGLFVHINPLQEWMQTEGDAIRRPPLETLQELLELVEFPVAIKEVGQGMGPKSLEAAIQLPLAAIEFGAFGGTNFSFLEMLRSVDKDHCEGLSFENPFEPMAYVGHCAEEMVSEVNTILEKLGPLALCREFIVSGGISSFLHGFSLVQSLSAKAVYGQAHALLTHANGDYEKLRAYVKSQLLGLELASRYLTLR